MNWTDQRIDRLITCWKTGAQYKTIANDLGIGLSTLKVRLAKLGLYRRKNRKDLSSKLNMRLDHKLLEGCRSKASKRGMQIAPYIRSLIEKDLSL